MVESNFIASLSISYDRIVPIGVKTAIMFGGYYIMGVGFGYGSHWLAPEISLLSFGPKHFLEILTNEITPYFHRNMALIENFGLPKRLIKREGKWFGHIVISYQVIPGI